MPKKIEKKAFVFHASYLEVMEEFPEEKRGKMAMALIDYGLGNNYDGESLMLLSLNPEERAALSPVIETIDTQKRRYENKKMLKGAIKIVREQIIEKMGSDSDNNTGLEKYEKTIELLEQMLNEVKNHNLDILPQEIEVMLPQELRKKFHIRFSTKTWEEQFKNMIEKWLEDNPQVNVWITPDIKEQVYKDMIYDFSKDGKLSASVAFYFEHYKEQG